MNQARRWEGVQRGKAGEGPALGPTLKSLRGRGSRPEHGEWLVDGRLIGRSVGCLVDRSVGAVGRLFSRSVSRSVGCLFGRSVGRSVGR